MILLSCFPINLYKRATIRQISYSQTCTFHQTVRRTGMLVCNNYRYAWIRFWAFWNFGANVIIISPWDVVLIAWNTIFYNSVPPGISDSCEFTESIRINVPLDGSIKNMNWKFVYFCGESVGKITASQIDHKIILRIDRYLSSHD
jgi:hypothetical protein